MESINAVHLELLRGCKGGNTLRNQSEQLAAEVA